MKCQTPLNLGFCDQASCFSFAGLPMCFECSKDLTRDQQTTLVALPPYVGMPCTIQYYSDAHPATVIYVSAGTSKIVVREDHAKRTDNNGMSDCQQYEFSPNPEGQEHTFFKSKTPPVTADEALIYGQRGKSCILGIRRAYYDYSY